MYIPPDNYHLITKRKERIKLFKEFYYYSVRIIHAGLTVMFAAIVIGMYETERFWSSLIIIIIICLAIEESTKKYEEEVATDRK